MSDDHLKKVKIFDYGYFQGRGMFQSLKALELALKYHNHKRKNGEEEVAHQFEIANLLVHFLHGTLNSEKIDRIIASSFLHDLIEDYPEKYSYDDLREDFDEEVYKIVGLVTKNPNFDKKNPEDQQKYYDRILTNSDAVLVKAADRIHNLQSAEGLSFERQKEYVLEVEDYFFPLLKAARKKYPLYHFTYIALAKILEMQVKFIKQMHLLVDSFRLML